MGCRKALSKSGSIVNVLSSGGKSEGRRIGQRQVILVEQSASIHVHPCSGKQSTLGKKEKRSFESGKHFQEGWSLLKLLRKEEGAVIRREGGENKK